MGDLFIFYLPVLGGILAMCCLTGAFRAGKKRWLVENLPTSKTTGVFIGFVELKGIARSSQHLTSYLAGRPCVHYEWDVEEHWSRLVTETYTDSKGNRQTRVRRESGWTSVADGGEMILFYLQDDCGVIQVVPEGAQIEPVELFDETCGPSDPLYYGKGPSHSIPNSDHRRRFTESGIPLNEELYVMGKAREREDVVAPEIASDPNAPIFLISTRTEEQVRSGFQRGLFGWGFFGLVLCVASFVFRDHLVGFDPARRIPIYIFSALGYFAVAAGAWIWMVYNALIDLRNRVRQAWSEVDVQLKRRHDLIPNLMESVKGYRDYERTLQTELAELRNQSSATPPGVAGSDYHSLRQTVSIIAERYPELKADQSFASLQKNLIDTEQRIALARGYFNEIATHYNTRLEIVPERFVARLGGMKPQVLLMAEDFERAPVKVDFAETQPL